MSSASKSHVKVVVSDINEGIATLVDPQHHVFQFPQHLLPDASFVGGIVEFKLAITKQNQVERLEDLEKVFDTIEREILHENQSSPRVSFQQPLNKDEKKR